jgi:hypothetical protein
LSRSRLCKTPICSIYFPGASVADRCHDLGIAVLTAGPPGWWWQPRWIFSCAADDGL